MNWIYVLLVAVVLIYVIFVLLTKLLFRRKWTLSDRAFFNSNLKIVMAEKDSRHRVMDLDKLLDQMLKRKGFQGSLGDKLKKAGSLFSDRNSVWEAHKLRNRIAHEMGFALGERDAAKAVDSFRKAFRDLGLDV